MQAGGKGAARQAAGRQAGACVREVICCARQAGMSTVVAPGSSGVLPVRRRPRGVRTHRRVHFAYQTPYACYAAFTRVREQHRVLRERSERLCSMRERRAFKSARHGARVKRRTESMRVIRGVRWRARSSKIMLRRCARYAYTMPSFAANRPRAITFCAQTRQRDMRAYAICAPSKSAVRARAMFERRLSLRYGKPAHAEERHGCHVYRQAHAFFAAARSASVAPGMVCYARHCCYAATL